MQLCHRYCSAFELPRTNAIVEFACMYDQLHVARLDVIFRSCVEAHVVEQFICEIEASAKVGCQLAGELRLCGCALIRTNEATLTWVQSSARRVVVSASAACKYVIDAVNRWG